MNKKVRHSVFETNSSTQHTLTIQRQIDPYNNLGLAMGAIPSDITFEFCNSFLENLEGTWDKEREAEIVGLCSEVEKLALCVAFCCNAYDNLQQETSGKYFWNYHNEMEDEDGNEIKTLNEVVKDKPFFKELIQAVKEERNTDLILVDGLYELDSLNDDWAFEGLIKEYSEKVNNNYVDGKDLVNFFKNIIFGEYTIFDELFPC